MIKGLSASLSGLNAFTKKVETTSNNLANVQTAGYKSRGVVQQSVQQGGAQVASVTISQQAGGLMQTGNPLNLSILGQGFFRVALPNGGTGFTRSGNFTKNSQGQLADANGNTLQPAISVPGNATSVAIDKTGTVSALVGGNTTVLGQLEISTFNNPGGLQSKGENLFMETSASGTALSGTPGSGGRGELLSGFLEASNVDIARESVSLMVSENGYKASINAIKTQNEMLGSILDLKA